MANDVIQLVIVGNSGGEFWECVQHWQTSVDSGADPVGEADQLIQGFIDSAMDAMSDIQSVDTFISGFKAKRVNNTGGPTVMRPLVPVPGAVAGEQINSASGYCIVSRYEHAAAWKSGRFFIPGIPETFIDGNHFTAPAIAAVATFIGAMGSFSSGGFGFTYGTWSGKFNLFHAPTYIALSSKVGIQRRRLLPVL